VADKVYGHYCGLAKALDVIGERWTLLVIRELALGPWRFSDLESGLSGISSSVLAERLARLEETGLVMRRTMPPPAASKVYALTRDGWDLAHAMVPLAAWGLRFLAAQPKTPSEAFRPAWGLMFQSATFDSAPARGVHDVYEYHIDDSVVSVAIDDGDMRVMEGPSERTPDVQIHADATTFTDVGLGRVRIRDAIRNGQLRLIGDAAARRRFIQIMRPLVGGAAG
jgi:DNA-binding HxlR family transcriptional regulator